MRMLGFGLFLSTLFAMVGCGDNPKSVIKFIDVKGTVTLADGSTLATGSINFEPETKDGSSREEATFIKDGSFDVKIAPGKYKVAVDMEAKGNKSTVPAKFRSFKTSDLHVEVTSSGTPLTISLK